MRRVGFLLVFACLAILVNPVASAGTIPVTPGDSGFGADFPDPTVLVDPAGYFAYATHPHWLESGGYFPILHSYDLKNWTYFGTALPDRPAWAVGDCWAPAIIRRRRQHRRGTFGGRQGRALLPLLFGQRLARPVRDGLRRRQVSARAVREVPVQPHPAGLAQAGRAGRRRGVRGRGGRDSPCLPRLGDGGPDLPAGEPATHSRIGQADRNRTPVGEETL